MPAPTSLSRDPHLVFRGAGGGGLSHSPVSSHSLSCTTFVTSAFTVGATPPFSGRLRPSEDHGVQTQGVPTRSQLLVPHRAM